MVRLALLRLDDDGNIVNITKNMKEIDSPEQVLKEEEEGEPLMEYPDTKLQKFWKDFKEMIEK